MVKKPPANVGDIRDVGLISGKIPWRRAWQPTPFFLSGESPWTEDPDGLVHGVAELDTTEVT